MHWPCGWEGYAGTQVLPRPAFNKTPRSAGIGWIDGFGFLWLRSPCQKDEVDMSDKIEDATTKKETKMKKHECKRFKTAVKRGGVRMLVKCRECGKKVSLVPIAGPINRLP